MTTPAVPQGWYPEPQHPELQRWWDGTQWTAQTQPAPATAPPPPPPPSPAQSGQGGVPEQRHRLFGGKHELEDEVARLNGIIDSLGVNERAALQGEIARLNIEVPQLRQEEATLQASVIPLRSEVATLSAERAQLDAVRAEVAQLGAQRDALMAETAQLRELQGQLPALQAELAELQTHVVETREAAILQEVGVYQYRHPLDVQGQAGPDLRRHQGRRQGRNRGVGLAELDRQRLQDRRCPHGQGVLQAHAARL